MTALANPLNLILFTADTNLHTKLVRDLRQSADPPAITVAKDIPSLQRATARQRYDGLIFEARRGTAPDLAKAQQAVDLSQTFVLAGSRDMLLKTAKMMGLDSRSNGQSSTAGISQQSLEAYFESKLGEFVKEMKHGSARDLHPMLMQTVERPLISHALRVTNGNQIKAAQLLGMNRNTLRKKIAELRIPVNRKRVRKA